MPKGGVDITEHVLFGKYRLCRKLGAGRSGTVYLAYHMELEEYRAMKIVPKTMADYDTFKREALFLKTLRHPGIPLVYDVEEDLDNSYLVEEYLEGESLYALVKRLGSLSMKTTVDLGIQVCRLIHFMNTSENPILYLDLQPKNLLVCNGIIRLIDFDHAQYAEDIDAFGERYGTAGFAAPEQYGNESLDCRTDVYAIGALLFFMSRGKTPGKQGNMIEPGENRELNRIIRGCMAERKEERYPNAGEVEQALCELKTESSRELAMESLNLVFAGAKHGIGTTHAALGISNFLTRNGYPALYQEEWETDAVRTMARTRNMEANDAGIYHMDSLCVRPFYGRSVKLPCRYFPAVVKDTGVSWKEGTFLPEADLYVMVCGGKWWEVDSTLQAARYFKACGRVLLLFNHMSKDIRLKLPGELCTFPCLYLPFFANPFKEDKSADACFGEILKAGTGGEKKWEGKKRGVKFWRRKPGL